VMFFKKALEDRRRHFQPGLADNVAHKEDSDSFTQ